MIGFEQDEPWREGRFYTAEISLFFSPEQGWPQRDLGFLLSWVETRSNDIFPFVKLWITFAKRRKRIFSTDTFHFSFSSWFFLLLPFLYFELKHYFKLKISNLSFKSSRFPKYCLFPCKVKLSNQSVSACCRNSQFHLTPFLPKSFAKKHPNTLHGPGSQAGAETIRVQWISAKH